MKLEPVNASIVILAKGHNPTILHPEFLNRNGIVPEAWVKNEKDIICTPAVAITKYNGENFVLFVDTSKFQVIDNAPGDAPGNSPIFKVASDYIGKLPHVSYTAVGLNFAGLLPGESEGVILSRFLKSDDSWQKKFQPKTMGVKLVFDDSGGQVSVSVETGSVTKAGEEPRHGILVQANFHFQLIGDDDAGKLTHAQKILTQHADNYQIVKEYVDAIVGLERNDA